VFATDSRCNGAADLIGSYDQTEASWVYSKLNAATFGASTALQQQCRALLTSYHKRVLAPAVANTGFRVLQPPFFTEFHLTASAFVGSLAAATDAAQQSTAGDDASVSAEGVALLGVTLDYTWGANPLNMVYVTDGGIDSILGSRNFRHPLRSDSLYSSTHAPPGLTVSVVYCVVLCCVDLLVQKKQPQAMPLEQLPLFFSAVRCALCFVILRMRSTHLSLSAFGFVSCR
jgi:hypothetical protein